MSEPTIDARLDQMSRHLEELLRHVGEVRRSNTHLKEGLDQLRIELKGDIDQLRTEMQAMRSELEQRMSALGRAFEHVAGKTDHFVEFVAKEITRARVELQEEIYECRSERRQIRRRLESMETRLGQLEAEVSSVV